MSVIVLGMNYPEHCFDCDDFYDGIYRHCKRTGKGFDDEEIDDDDINWHPDWCPLRPMPNVHGDLIDRDALPSRVEWEDIVNAPAIVGAEGKESMEITVKIYFVDGNVYIDLDEEDKT